ncbi:hypothetical protein PCANC_09550 [Puccinia coronata f. sp. avenae]|uniref:Uncharacterized protein n=1 Tax=Puccinia coronata f. sp. avenae TaxID=200324 RepID=A0A2N5V517_9BASI|nr:hypothetical protein PCASD_21725 [Puccinia coronata f. sp. avenae]PLW10000.1 hypothetical protein PCANC_19789 [Puccinia coronata f. sp. avenae]PLW34794.1 hypothetical protein PCASD_12659 [Puccinia coronata f. sp. avenae]PLW45070.1 hypothetical protein PCANC_09550 [Puccinia coronata f. sp. avenae]
MNLRSDSTNLLRPPSKGSLRDLLSDLALGFSILEPRRGRQGKTRPKAETAMGWAPEAESAAPAHRPT